MDEQKLNHKPHVGPEPVEAKPNHVREKTFQTPNAPNDAAEADRALPDGEARDKVSGEMNDAADEIRKRL